MAERWMIDRAVCGDAAPWHLDGAVFNRCHVDTAMLPVVLMQKVGS